MLIAAGIIIIIIGTIHSLLGEKTVIQPLLARDTAPPYIKRLMRVGWHITTFFWWAIAAHLVAMHFWPGRERESFLTIMSMVFGLSAIVALIASRGRHLSWIGFGSVTALMAWVLWS